MGRSDTGLHDWILSVCYRSNLDDRKRRLCITGVAGKLRHRLTGIGINILSDGLVVAKITFQDILCICDTFFRNSQTVCQLYCFASQCPCDLQLVIAKGCSRCFKTRTHVNSRVKTDGNRNRHIFPLCTIFVKECAQMTGTGSDPHAQLIPGFNAETVNGHIARSVFRISSHAQSHRNIRACIFGCIGRCRNKRPQVKIRIGCIMNNLLTVDMFAFRNHHRRNCLFELFAHILSQKVRIGSEQHSDSFTAGKHTDRYSCIRKALYIIKQHRRTLFGRAGNGSACTHMTIYTGNLGIWINLCIRCQQLSRNCFQEL